MAQKLSLYNYYRSSTSYRVRIALHLKNIPFEYKPVHLVNQGGEQHQAEYKSLNPMSEVPTLVDGNNVIAQSFAIIEYLDEVYPEPPLFPKNPYQRALVRQFCENINCGIHPLQNLKTMKLLETDYGFTAEQKKSWIQHWVQKGLTAQEELLNKYSKKYCFGSEITAADLFLVPQIFSAKRFEVDISMFKKTNAVVENCLKHPAFIKADPNLQPDSPA